MRRKRNPDGLSGSKTATVSEAREMLRAAVDEAKGKGAFACRQAAEKVWLSVTTASDAVAGPRSNTKEVFAAMRQAWGAEGEAAARNTHSSLHIGAFYSKAESCNLALIEDHAKRLRAVFNERSVRSKTMRERLARKRRDSSSGG